MSRLVENSVSIRNKLNARNIYNPNDPYRIETSTLTKTVNALAGIVKPFSSFDLTNTIVGKLIGTHTPIARIGLVQLAKQFGYTAASNAAAEYLPAIKFTNLFDGNPNTKFIMKHIDYQITRRETQSSIRKILEEVSGVYVNKSPFNKNPTNAEYVRNTGKGQLQLLSLNLNRNIYKPTNKPFIDAFEGQGLKILSGSELIATKIYFSSQDQNLNPFIQYKLQYPDIANSAMIVSENNYRVASSKGSDGSNYLEYGATQEFIDSMGKTIIRNNSNGAGEYNFEFFAEKNYGLEDDSSQQIVWGRDGVSKEYSKESQGLSFPFDGVDNDGNPYTNSRFNFTNQATAFKINHGLLNYTKELLNSKGKYGSFDLTRKKFIDRDQQVHFNGSPLDKTPSGNLNLTRQHAVSDPYDRFVKAIRFNGNKVYGGNQNSVIYNSVIPKIHPILNGENVDIRNMMFSIENLAAVTVKDTVNSVAYLDDGFGTELPLSEAGFLGGRIMWFPPYDIQLSEQAIARHETTTFLGRGEPIYTYNNSERIASLSFKLLIDYPPQTDGQNHVYNSRFFAFGGETSSETPTTNIGQKEADKKILLDQRDSIIEVVEQADPQINYPQPLSFYFPNDEPGNALPVQNGIDSIISILYEDGNANIDGRNIDLNGNFVNNITTLIQDYLSEEKREFIKIELIGSASQLGPSSEYNIALSSRRIESMLQYINSIYITISNGKTVEQNNIKVVKNPIGGVGGTSTDEVSEISTDEAKLARKVIIRFTHSGKQATVTKQLTSEDQQSKKKLDEDIQNIDQEISRQKTNALNSKFYFKQYTVDDGILKGFDSMENNKYKPVFHSQTPEDFHRRLTFLQQCTRQGNAIRKTQKSESGEISFSAKNSVFGRQPVCILRIGDFFNTKVIVENINFDYTESPWDLNPEGMGMQFMIANITMQMKVIGGQSLRGPIDVLQNAVSFNYYANSTFYNTGVYKTATNVESAQYGVDDGTGENSVTKKVSDDNKERINNNKSAIDTKQKKNNQS